MNDSNRFRIVLVCLALMSGTLTTALVWPEPTAGHGLAHPEFPSMNQGGTADRHAGLLLVGWSYGIAQIILLGICLTLGLKGDRSQRSHGTRWLAAAALIYGATFTALMFAYAVRGAEPGAVLGIPTATVLLVLGIWTTPFLFTALYAWNFRRWIFDDGEAERFAALKARYRPESGDG